MSSPQYSQDYVIDIKPEVGRISPSRITALERRISPPKRISKERIAELERRLTPRSIPSSSMTMVKPKRKYTKRTSSKKRSYKKRGSKKYSRKRSSKKRSSSCGRGYTSVRTYVRSDTKTRVSRHCSRIGKRRSRK